MASPLSATAPALSDVPRLRVLTEADIAAAARLVACSLDQDPGSVAFVSDHVQRLRFNELGAQRVVQTALSHATVYGAEVRCGLAGVAVWHPPAAQLGSPSATVQYYGALARNLPMLRQVVARLGATLLREHRAIRRFIGQHRAAIREASDGPTWHLAALATDADHRGRGIARLLIDHVLQRCDADGLAAWLETGGHRKLAMATAA